MKIVYSNIIEILNKTIAALKLNYANEDQYHEIRNQIEEVFNNLSALTKH